MAQEAQDQTRADAKLGVRVRTGARQPANDRAHARADNAGNGNTLLFQLAQDGQMGKTLGPPTSQHDHHRWLLEGCR